ncbi:hypothetical protein [Streptomyces sp. 11-1-2]|uniref:hypothetical protein n=1 Tax=Streptomyces sp. 11-1-2 TaxID=1851167 RepID=UPI000B8D967A|nr:hypothetical protein [Streptomyces sp. 11-1-2]ASQ95662.1 hypothetical protein CGL27_23690 [Streptomyces sp. 11-1-2]
MLLALTSTRFAMTQDFAAISSATLAALLILAFTELQSGLTVSRQLKDSLYAEYVNEIRSSLDEYYSETPIPEPEKMRVERELKHFRERMVRGARVELAWKFWYGIAMAYLALGLWQAIQWSALAKQSRGYDTAFTIVLSIASGGLQLGMGFLVRQLAIWRRRAIDFKVRLSKDLGIPDADHAQILYDGWQRAKKVHTRDIMRLR